MSIERRRVLALSGSLALSGCVGLGDFGSPGRRRWRTQSPGAFVSTRPLLLGDKVAVARADGTLALLDRETGSVVGPTERGGRGNYAGTAPVQVGEQVVSVTDEVLTVDDTGTVVWNESLSGGEYATTASRPVVADDALYVTTSAPELLRLDVSEQSIHRVGSEPLDARWWHPTGVVDDSSRVAVGTGTRRAALVDFGTGAVEWSRSVDVVPYPCRTLSSVLTQERVADTGADDSRLELVQYDPEEDKEWWRTELPGPQPTFTALIGREAMVVVTRARSQDSATPPAWVQVIEPDSGWVRATREVPAGVTHTGAVHDGTAYLTTGDGRVLSVAPEGEVTTRFAGDVSPASAPAVRGDVAVFGTDDAEVVAVELE